MLKPAETLLGGTVCDDDDEDDDVDKLFVAAPAARNINKQPWRLGPGSPPLAVPNEHAFRIAWIKYDDDYYYHCYYYSFK